MRTIRFFSLITLHLSFFFISACTPYIKQTQLNPNIKSQLSTEILEMDKKDQLYRWVLLFGETDLDIVDSLSQLPTEQKIKHIKKRGAPGNKLKDRQYDSIKQIQDSLDKANRDRILQIYQEYGWPGKELVGVKAAGLIGTLMLHFPDSLMVALYPKLKKEYKRGNITGSNVAHMWDKHLLINKQPLLYGMFKHVDTVTKATLPPMIRDIKETNKARKKLGLPLLEQYRLLGKEMDNSGAQREPAQSEQYQGKQWLRLQSELSEHTVFGLGEVGHGYESINEAKALLVDFLKRQMGLNGVVFESSLTLSTITYLRGDSLSNRLKYSLYPFWNTASVKTSLEPFYQLEKLNKPLIMGCDVQEDCRFTILSQYLVNEGLIKVNISKLHVSDSILAYYIGKDFSRRGVLATEEYIILIDNYKAIATELKSYSLPEVNRKLLLRSLDNRMWLCRYLTLSSAKDRMYYRDSLMAENVVWLKNELYPQDKIAIWAANTHISRKKSEDTQPRWMGEWLSSNYKGLYFPIAFQKGSFANPEVLGQEIGVRYASEIEKFSAVILLKKLRKISSYEWRTPCE